MEGHALKNDSIIIAGYYGFGNAGDELILLAIIQKLRHDHPFCRIIVLSRNPEQTKHEFGVDAVNRWRPWQWISPLLHGDRFILGGGGLLQESTGPWNHFYYLSLLLLAKLSGCQTEVYRIGVDPIRAAFNRFWTRWILNHFADTISVRDEISNQALLGIGVHGPIAVERDPVFELPTASSENADKGGIAFAVSPWPARPQWAKELAVLCDRLHVELHAPIDLLVFFPSQDEVFSLSVARCSSAIRQVR